MLRRSHVGLAAAIVSSTIIGTALPTLVAHADATTLYVNNGLNANCSDAGTGTATQPYCHIQAAADAAQPGQTVSIAAGWYQEQVTLKNSGTPGSPITFAGPPIGATGQPSVRVGLLKTNSAAQNSPHAFVASGVHDITIKQIFSPATLQEPVLVADSDHITLDRDRFMVAGSVVQNAPTVAPGVRLTGKTTNTTISRSRIGGNGGPGIAVAAGVAGTVITTNSITSNRAGGIVVTDAPGTVVTSNSIAENCHGGLTLAGNSSGATIENNVIAQNVLSVCASGEVDLSVSAGSVTGTKADYNVVHPASGGVGYSWGGSTYASSAGFGAATGQGAHDLDTDPKFTLHGWPADDLTPAADSPVIDSADANAPGELDTDLNGNARVDDPLVANTGTGAGYNDRGSIELQDPLTLWVGANSTPTPGHPLDATISGTYSSPWYQTQATLDLGDGTTGPATFPVTHTYAAPGSYQVTLTVAEIGGTTSKAVSGVTVQLGFLSASMTVSHSSADGAYVTVNASGTSSPWPVSSVSYDFGDGTPAVPADALGTVVGHRYAAPGLYNIAVTVVDDHGRSNTAVQGAHVNFAVPGDVPLAGKWSTTVSTIGVFNNGSWAGRRNSVDAQYPDVFKARFGQPGDVPVSGNWDGSGTNTDEMGIYRAGVFGLEYGDGSVTVVPFGDAGDVPVPGNWDHNGHAQLAIYRPSIRTFAVRHDDGSVTTATFGDLGDVPIVGDWDGVGHTQMGIYRPGTTTFALRHDDGSISAANYGQVGDQPIVGDWFGTGRTTFGVYRPSTATFTVSGAYAGKPDQVAQLY